MVDGVIGLAVSGFKWVWLGHTVRTFKLLIDDGLKSGGDMVLERCHGGRGGHIVDSQCVSDIFGDHLGLIKVHGKLNLPISDFLTQVAATQLLIHA